MTDDRRLHVLISAYACDPTQGSEPGIGWNWVRVMSAHCRVTVITRANNRRRIDAWLAEHALPNVTFHYVDLPSPLRLRPATRPGPYRLYLAWQVAALGVARAILRDDPFDLCHHITYGSIQSPIVLQRLPRPLVFGPVGGGEMGPRSFWSGGGSRARLYEEVRSIRALAGMRNPLVRSTLDGAARILVTTRETERLVPREHCDKTRVMVAAGIEAEQLERVSVSRSSRVALYTAGRLLHWKGFHLAVDAFARIAGRYPQATFTIVGDGPQRERLAAQVSARGLEGRVRLAGSVPRDEVLRIAASSDIFVFPSLHDSGGIAVLEAMAAGKPVVCLDTGGPGGMITPECGVAVPVTDPAQVVAALSSALDRLLASPELRARLGAAAMERARDVFVWERKAEEMLALYHEALEAPR